MSFHVAPASTGRPGHRVWIVAMDGPPPDEWAASLAEAGLDLVVANAIPAPLPARSPVPTPPAHHLDESDEDATELVFDADTAPPGSQTCRWMVEVSDDGPILLWHPDGFEEALVRLSDIHPAHLRARTIVCAPGAPPAGFGDLVRNQGGLSWWRTPWEPWIVKLACDALQRQPGPGILVPPRALENLQRDAKVRPHRFLMAVADAAREALNASFAEVLLLAEDAEGCQRLMWEGERIELTPLPSNATHIPPMGLAERAIEWRQVVVIPDMNHARVASGGAWASAIAVPILVDDGMVGERAVLQVYWDRPFLPTPAELQVLRTLGTAASVNQARDLERKRLHQAHMDSLKTLDRVRWTTHAANDDSTTEEELVQFAYEVLVARSAMPGLKAFYARLSTSSLTNGVWIQVDGIRQRRISTAHGRRVEAARQRCLEQPNRPLEKAPDTFVLAIDIWSPARTHCLGSLVATFKDRYSAEEASDSLHRLAEDLKIGLRLIRRSNDNAAMKELARQLADATDARVTLDRMAGLIQRQLDADGVKVWVLSDAGMNAQIEQIHRTGRGQEMARPVVVDPKKGLADWVVLHDDWLCIEHPSPTEGEALQPTPARTGHHERVEVSPRSVRELWCGTLPDAESVQLLVPLHHQHQVAGVLGVWRSTAMPFETVLDVETLMDFAPHVSSACARAKAMERAQGEANAISHLARTLTPETPLHAFSHAILNAAGTLSSAHHAILLRHDITRPGTLVTAGSWSCAGDDAPALASPFPSSVAWGTDASDWTSQCEALLQKHASASPSLLLRQLVVLPPDGSQHPVGAVALFVAQDRPVPVPILAESATQQYTKSLLQYGGLLFNNHIRVHAAAVVDQLTRGGLTDIPPIDRAADRLRQSIHDAIVVVTRGNGKNQEVATVFPQEVETTARRVDAKAVARSGGYEPICLTDLESLPKHLRRQMDAPFAESVRASCEWSGLRSWMAVPIVHGRHLLGTFQVFTPPRGTALLPEHQTIAVSLARWAAEETIKSTRRSVLEQLNTIASTLAGVTPNVLSEELPQRLHEWTKQALLRSCQVAVIAHSGPNLPLVASGSGGLSTEDLDALGALSRHHARAPHTWVRRTPLPSTGSSNLSQRFAGAALPLRLASDSPLVGHLIVLHANAFEPTDLEMLDIAAREMAVLLHGEATRQELKHQNGVFRHALIGPVQGLQSAAKFLEAMSRNPNPSLDQMATARDRIAEESQTLRMWRETQKLYTMIQEGQPLDLRPRVQPLRPLLQRCIGRYEAPMRLRNISLDMNWEPQGSVRFAFDGDMLGMVISNLLDNACKYSFFHREVRVTVQAERTTICITVENIGAAIPEDQGEAIYLAGTRVRGRDPIRAIAGEGLGLYLAQKITLAMGGELGHSSEAVGALESETQPHRVRFTLRLPHHWNRR